MNEELSPTEAVIDLVLREIRSAVGWINKLPRSRENSIAITKLEEAELWFQKGHEPK